MGAEAPQPQAQTSMLRTRSLTHSTLSRTHRHTCVPTQQASQAHGEMAILMHCVVWVGSQAQGNLAVDAQR